MSEQTTTAPVNAVVHTPGPWECERSQGWVTADKGQMSVAEIRGWGYLSSRNDSKTASLIQDANARLIAAAPELIEAIKRIQHFITGACDMPINRRLKCIEMECEASIAKVL